MNDRFMASGGFEAKYSVVELLEQLESLGAIVQLRESSQVLGGLYISVQEGLEEMTIEKDEGDSFDVYARHKDLSILKNVTEYFIKLIERVGKLQELEYYDCNEQLIGVYKA